MSSDTIRRRLVVHGKVQGVFFRDSTREAAQNEGVAGWASNRPDGSVEVVLEGPPDAVESVAGYVRRGPSSAQETPEGLTGFRIR
jgi:acylphosphatase